MSPRRKVLAAAAAACALAACSGRKAEPGPGAAMEPSPGAAMEPGPGAVAAPVSAGQAPGAAETPTPVAVASPIPAEARQLILGVVSDWEAVPVELSRWERSSDGGPWKLVGEPWSGVVGSGTAWGRGLHGEGPPTGQSGPDKQEGDGRSPAGAFALGGAYGYAKAAPAGTRWSYTPVDASWHCVDDSASAAYGTIVDTDAVKKDWSSSEKMKRKDDLYTWVVDVAHNPAHTAKAGSCIFLHVWRAAGTPTVGCTAMPQPQLESVLAWVSPAARPVYVLLPLPAYAALGDRWGLPTIATQ